MIRKSAFTLIELLVSISIFTVIITIVSSLFVTSFRLRQEVAIREQLYADARFLLERLAMEIRGSTLDYEEYFNMNVMAGAGGASGVYGANYGRYVTQFINPGIDGFYGSTCNIPRSCSPIPNATTGCYVWTPGIRCTILQSTIDEHTGQNPFKGHLADNTTNIPAANAFCGFVDTNGDPSDSANPSGCDGSTPPSSDQSELYLISGDGFEKTLFRRRTDAGNQLLTMMKMRGTDNDGDGVAEEFTRTEDYVGSDVNSFVPISPNRLNVSKVIFYISPLESPFHGYSEPNASMLHLPIVTILLTVSPNPTIAGVHAGDFTLTLQETVSTEIRNAPPAPVLGRFDR